MASFLPRKNNLNAAIAISEVVRTSLGPHARNKLLIDDVGHLTSTNDGHTLLKGLPVEHPVGELVVQLSSGQDDAIGDGTTSVVVIFGALCRKAVALMDKGLHPSAIIDGYQKACDFAKSELDSISKNQHAYAEKIKDDSKPATEESKASEVFATDSPTDDLLKFLANTALHSKVAQGIRSQLASICVESIKMAKKSMWVKSAHNIIVYRKEGGNLEDTRLFSGLILPKSYLYNVVTNTKVAVLSCSLDPPRPKTQYSIDASTPEAQAVIRNLSTRYAQDTLQKLKSLDIGFVFCQWGIDPFLIQLMAENGIVAVKWVSGPDLEKVAMTVGALICPYLPTLTAKMLGSSPNVAEVLVGNNTLVEIEGTGVTIEVRGTQTVAEAAIISINDALFVLENAYTDPRTAVGGGATELELYNKVCDFATQHTTVDQYSITAWAEALLSIPSTLAENASFDAPETISKLIAHHRKGEITAGVGTGTPVTDIAAVGIWELLSMKHMIISLATESACQIIKIDECIIFSQHKT